MRKEILSKLKEMLISMDKDKYSDLDINTMEELFLSTDLSLSSINMLYLIILIGNEFQIDVKEAKLSSFATVKDVVDFIMEKKNEVDITGM